MSRVDAALKASGHSRYVADFALPNMAYAAVVRSAMAHARIVSIDTSAALSCPGVIAVFTASDVSETPYGRALIDTPLLARDKVRFVGERVAAVVATTRQEAEYAAAMIEVDYEPLDAVFTSSDALAPGAPAVHEQPWAYKGAAAKEGDPINLIHRGTHGSKEEVDTALEGAAFVVDHHYTTQGVHQGYLEPQA